ncbi:kinase-like domain-containing protein [Gigaspora rosea]|uniref:Kinase-like domain-containing protein n=1 Tax=Gigaspora rosea TaxID=44941 RepID=A0A397ULJ8_9GLOM|nr:kinase-like domain-containing protein [Gigaspora rosea]
MSLLLLKSIYLWFINILYFSKKPIIRYNLINSVWEEATLKARLYDDFGDKPLKEWRKDQLRFFKENTILTPIETQYFLDRITKIRDTVDARHKLGEISTCNVCNLVKYSKIYCEFCMRKKLKNEKWTSENQKLDIFIRNCQNESPVPYCIIEWIKFCDLENVKVLAKGGFGEVYSAVWTRGEIVDWNTKENDFAQWNQVFNRNQTIRAYVVGGLGFTRNHDGKYMIVLDFCESDLRKYLQKNRKMLSWKDKVKIAWDISVDIQRIVETGSVHGDLHPGNILLLNVDMTNNYNNWVISDLGTCGPIDTSDVQGKVKGILPYMAPELFYGGRKTQESDIYAFGMIMWTISAECTPFSDLYDDISLVFDLL